MINLAAAWIADPRTVAVMDALEAAGGAGCARFVGGAVRNALLGAVVDDIDIATTLTPQAVSAALAAASLRAVPTGIDHGTVTAISGGRPFEITTLRRDVSTDGRHAVVAFTDDWALDAGRRDFTMNALYADRAGAVLDPTGVGVADALAGRVAFVGDPQTRIREDYLRVMRFFRFHAWYGAGEPDRAALAACAALKGPVAALAAERVSKELMKLLAAQDPRAALAAMAETGVLAIATPGLENLGRLSGLVEVEAQLMAEPDAGLRLAALLDDDPPASAAFAQRLRLPNALRDRLAAALDPSLALTSWMSPREARRAVYQIGQAAFADRVKLTWAAAPNSAQAPQWRALLALGETWTPPTLPVSGVDAVAAGTPKGPLVGAVLREVEAWWIDQDFPDDRAAAAERLKAVVQGMVP